MSSSQNLSSSSDASRLAFGPLLDVSCRVEIVLGTGVMSVRDCLKLRKNSIIRIDEPAGLDMEVRVNGVGVAHGEVLIVDDSTSIRITEVLAPPSADGL